MTLSNDLRDYIVHPPIRLSGTAPDDDGEYTLEELREHPRNWRYLQPFERFEAGAFCPICDCARSGSVDMPNPRQEPCEDASCRCHEDGE